MIINLYNWIKRKLRTNRVKSAFDCDCLDVTELPTFMDKPKSYEGEMYKQATAQFNKPYPSFNSNYVMSKDNIPITIFDLNSPLPKDSYTRVPTYVDYPSPSFSSGYSSSSSSHSSDCGSSSSSSGSDSGGSCGGGD